MVAEYHYFLLKNSFKQVLQNKNIKDVILIPEDYNEPELRKIAEALEKAACDANIQILF